MALLLFGPSKLLGLPQRSLALTLVGMALLGVSASGIFVPLL